MFECVTSFVLVEHLYDHTFDPPTGQWGYQRVINPNRKPYRTKDGFIGLLPYTDKQWDLFFEAAGFGEQIKSDPRFADYSARAKHTARALRPRRGSRRDEDDAGMARPAEAVVDPVVKTNTLEDLDADPHLLGRGLLPDLRAPEIGRYRLMKPPVRFSKSPANLRRHPPGWASTPTRCWPR